MRTGRIGVKLTACIITIVAIASAQQARAGVYPTNACVSAKMKAAGAYCQSALKAWSIWDNNHNDASRETALTTAITTLGNSWSTAETTAAAKDADCVETTLPLTGLGGLQPLVDNAVADIVTGINTGLDLVNSKDDAKCGMKLLNAAAKKCKSLLRAEATYIKKLGKKNADVNRDKQKTTASGLFAGSWSDATAGGCTPTASKDDIEGIVDDLDEQVVTDTTWSPNVDDTQFTTITPPGSVQYLGKTLEPICMNGTSPYAFFVKRGSVNKLLMYYQGGGACWDQVTCGGTDITLDHGVRRALCDTTVDPSGGDNPNNQTLGFADRTNPDNPFKDWNIVFVSYCSCDIHYGDADQDYKDYDGVPIHVAHHGFQNAKVAEKWAREHFLNPEMVFVTGSSAGSYGALFNAPLLHQVWPGAKFRVLGDAGNGVITQDFLLNEFPHWNFASNLPTYVPGVKKSFSPPHPTGMVGYIEAVAKYFPETPWAHYSTAYDGSMGGQTGFYNVMANPDGYAVWTKWWRSSCEWNEKMVQQAGDTYTAVDAGTKNYRYYIGTGSRHTMWGSNKVYTDTTGGVPKIVDWINAMLNGKDDPGWVNVTAVPDNVLLVYGPGDEDPRPSPLEAPFSQPGSDVIVTCP